MSKKLPSLLIIITISVGIWWMMRGSGGGVTQPSPTSSAHEPDQNEGANSERSPTDDGQNAGQSDGQQDAAAHQEEGAGHDDVEAPHFRNDEVVAFPARDYWFKPTSLTAEGRFEQPAIAIKTDETCAGSALVHEGDTLSRALEAGVGVSGREPFPDDMHFQTFSQFWSISSHFYQVSAVWKEDQPATYRLEFFRFSNPQLSGEPERLEVPGADQVLDAAAAMQWIQQKLAEALKQGAVRGARVMEAKVAAPRQSKGHEIVWVNGIPASWIGPGVTCLTQPGLSFASCRCADPKE